METVKPVRLQYRRTKGFKLVSPNGLPNVCVDRRSKWGNPFRIGEVFYTRYNDEKKLQDIVITKDNCLVFFRKYAEEVSEVLREELRGKNLVCWCKPGNPCHADVLLEIANR